MVRINRDLSVAFVLAAAAAAIAPIVALPYPSPDGEDGGFYNRGVACTPEMKQQDGPCKQSIMQKIESLGS